MAIKYACFFQWSSIPLLLHWLWYTYIPIYYPRWLPEIIPRMHQKPTLREAKIAGSWPIKVAGALAQNASLIVHDLVGRWGYMAPPCNTGWWFQPLWKILISQLGLLFPIYGKIKNVPNNQPVSGRNHLANYWGFYMGCLFVVSTSTAG